MEEENFKVILEEYIKNKGAKYSTTHTKLCFMKIFRIYKRVIDGYGPKFGDIKVHNSTNLIIDGNHRFIAYELAKFNYNTISWSKNFSDVKKNICDLKIDYTEDWDKNCKDTEKYCSDDFLKEL